jgi:hypothetical protein
MRCVELHPEPRPAAVARVNVLEAGTDRLVAQLDLCSPCLAAFVAPWARWQGRPMMPAAARPGYSARYAMEKPTP